jgi:hypothetical protein
LDSAILWKQAKHRRLAGGRTGDSRASSGAGLRQFKIKVGDRFDLDQLGRIEEVLDRETSGDYRVTLDGNGNSPTCRRCQFWEDL